MIETALDPEAAQVCVLADHRRAEFVEMVAAVGVEIIPDEPQ